MTTLQLYYAFIGILGFIVIGLITSIGQGWQRRRHRQANELRALVAKLDQALVELRSRRA